MTTAIDALRLGPGSSLDIVRLHVSSDAIRSLRNVSANRSAGQHDQRCISTGILYTVAEHFCPVLELSRATGTRILPSISTRQLGHMMVAEWHTSCPTNVRGRGTSEREEEISCCYRSMEAW